MSEKYLNEENFQKTKKKISGFALIILFIGLLIGGGLIFIGVNNQLKVKYANSEERKAFVTTQLEVEKESIIKTKNQLEEKIKLFNDEIKSLEREPFTGFDDAYYARKDEIEELKASIVTDKKTINLINNVLNYGGLYCSLEAENNVVTARYCSLYIELDNINKGTNKSFDFSSTMYYMFGAFFIVGSFMIASSTFMFSKGREISAFTAQQGMPIQKEYIDKMSPTIGNAAGEIVKGIKKGLRDE